MTHENIIAFYEAYIKENEKFNKGNNAAGTRARKALNELVKLSRARRKEIQEYKNANNDYLQKKAINSN